MDENRTVLLIGEFGNADDDPPVKAVIVDDVLRRHRQPSGELSWDPSLVFLDAGPEIILGRGGAKGNLVLSGRGTSYPTATKQVVR